MLHHLPRLVQKVWDPRKLRYLVVGAWNTLFGYILMVGSYQWIGHRVHIFILSLLNNFITISVSFLSYKIFVFQTKGLWLKQWLKSFVVYGMSALLSTIQIWILVDFFGVNIYLSQALSMISGVILSYLGHKNYTFK